MNIEIASLSEFDRLVISGDAFLGGTLNVIFLNGFLESSGDSFEIMTFNSLVGGFDTVSFFGGNGLLSLVETETSLLLEEIQAGVPEPSSVLLLLIGAFAFIRSRRVS